MRSNGDKLRIIAWMVGMMLGGIIQARADVDADRNEARILKEYESEPAANPYLQSIVSMLSEASPEVAGMALRPKAIKSQLPMAFALSNGALFASTGLLARLKSDAQVACVLAPEIAEVFLHQQPQYKNKPAVGSGNLVGKLLLITVTAGLAAVPLANSDREAYEKEQAAFEHEADKLGLQWAAAAGWDTSEASAGIRRLVDALSEEHRFGMTDLANKERLTQKLASFASTDVEKKVIPARPISSPVSLNDLSRKLALQVIVKDLSDSGSERPVILLNRLDRESAPSVETDCLRARYVRNSAVGSEVSEAAVVAYEKCVAWPASNPDFLKELGFLQQYRGNAQAAKAAFERYLLKAPNAADVPIVKGYVEELSK